MPIRRLPSEISVPHLSRPDRFLYEVMQGLQSQVEITEAPVIRFMATVRNHFADGCALILLDDDTMSGGEYWFGSTSERDWISRELRHVKPSAIRFVIKSLLE